MGRSLRTVPRPSSPAGLGPSPGAAREGSCWSRTPETAGSRLETEARGGCQAGRGPALGWAVPGQTLWTQGRGHSGPSPGRVPTLSQDRGDSASEPGRRGREERPEWAPGRRTGQDGGRKVLHTHPLLHARSSAWAPGTKTDSGAIRRGPPPREGDTALPDQHVYTVQTQDTCADRGPQGHLDSVAAPRPGGVATETQPNMQGLCAHPLRSAPSLPASLPVSVGG